MSNKEKIFLLIAAGKNNEEITKETNISLRSVQRYRKQFKQATEKRHDKTTRGMTATSDRKQKKEVVKALITTGATIKEAANKVDIPLGTVNRWTYEDDLIKKQVEFLKDFRDKQRKRILNNKLKRLETNEKALEAIQHEINNYEENGRISKSAMEKLLINEQLEQLIFELDRIERLEKNDTSDTTENKVMEYLETLRNGLGGKDD
ncbi:hypothetical protein IX317_000367 [Fusobacterium sp. DD29]|uniref:hypothetical protein n=1 Tax=unclassified Fusobacterium TaxID=2648384 RepID=UPI001B8CF3A6|nr:MULTISPECIES: hypothetical protein [unclassified Fusobacterium]MBR8748708.1 hypothetical protein [Fusobacterium sp. DD29]MBR8760940.1 hypothetical protein [Fusobacterium sp. DD25]MBR8766987.1 hypothetical protein [Fusobacterium sp. DD43]MBR8770988.1 hypothetical protein [Fusobacterium sp. DD40]MBR8775263.1 hypothetical protein [Fusobacterium sp. DD17]